MSIFTKVKFGDLLHKVLRFIAKAPVVWFGYTLFLAVILCLSRISYALGIFSSVAALFIGVGVAKYIDLKYTPDAVGLMWAIKKSLPLAIIFGGIIVLCWFIFSALANLLGGQPEMISYFFFDWQLTPENLNRRTLRELAIWFYGYANICLIFTLMMLCTFASWYSYPLMLFKDYTWSQAKAVGNEELTSHREAYYKTLGFLVFEAILCMEITPILTPVLYMLTSTFMFIMYKKTVEKS